jgi:hypothetical protein
MERAVARLSPSMRRHGNSPAPPQTNSHGRQSGKLSGPVPLTDPLKILQCRTLRADSIGCVAELAANFFIKNFVPQRRAITFDNLTGAHISMAFRRVVAHTDSYIFVERANGYRAGGWNRPEHGSRKFRFSSFETRDECVHPAAVEHGRSGGNISSSGRPS